MPFCQLRLVETKPKNDSYLWKSDLYAAHPQHIGEETKKHRFDLKMTAVECRKILGVDKSTLTKWEQGRHEPNEFNRQKILRFLG
jgi:DNA-binding transcriptional regulator YiaG